MNKTVIKCLMRTGEACTKANAEQIKKLHKMAQVGAANINAVGARDVYNIGMTDKLERLKRNMRALEYLLSMAADVLESARSEITDIFQADEAAEKALALKRQEALDKAIASDEKAIANRRYREKQPAE